MAKITLITAFFDIGRGNMNGSYLERNTNKYIEYFEFWAGIKNDLIIYTQKEYATRIFDIREKKGMKDHTKIVVIDDIFKIEEKVFMRMKKIEENEDYINFRYIKSDISNRADYNYIMMMKYWFLKDSVDRFQIDEFVAWFDFGFNHGGKVFNFSEDFNFKWNYDFEEKINLFSLRNPDEVCGIESVQLFIDCIMGSPVVLPSKYANILWEHILTSAKALLLLDSIDDDQQLLLMSYKMEPEIFKINKSDWFLPIKQFGNPNMRVRKIEKDNLITILRKTKYRFLLKFNFIKRCIKRINKFYSVFYDK